MTKKLLLLFFLVGCAQQQTQPSRAQLAVLAYYVDICEKQGVSADNTEAMKGCILVNYQRDLGTSSSQAERSHFGDVLRGMGDVYSAGAGRDQTSCSSRPALGGGWNTTCY